MRTWKGLPRITLFPHHHHVLCHVICCVLAREELRVCWHEGGSKGTRRSFVTEQSWRGGILPWLVRVTGKGGLQVWLGLEKTHDNLMVPQLQPNIHPQVF